MGDEDNSTGSWAAILLRPLDYVPDWVVGAVMWLFFVYLFFGAEPENFSPWWWLFGTPLALYLMAVAKPLWEYREDEPSIGADIGAGIALVVGTILVLAPGAETVIGDGAFQAVTFENIIGAIFVILTVLPVGWFGGRILYRLIN